MLKDENRESRSQGRGRSHGGFGSTTKRPFQKDEANAVGLKKPYEDKETKKPHHSLKKSNLTVSSKSFEEQIMDFKLEQRRRGKVVKRRAGFVNKDKEKMEREKLSAFNSSGPRFREEKLVDMGPPPGHYYPKMRF